jgi:hypothetical protein
MSKAQVQVGRGRVDLSESSVWGHAEEDGANTNNVTADGDTAREAAIDRLEAISGGADDPLIAEGELGEQFDELDASTEEEVDALKVNLLQDNPLPHARDGSGYIVDDIAEERISRLTETGPFQDGQGTISVAPGNDDTSATLRRHRPNTEGSHTDAIVEGNVDAPQDEIKSDAMADEGTGA